MKKVSLRGRTHIVDLLLQLFPLLSSVQLRKDLPQQRGLGNVGLAVAVLVLAGPPWPSQAPGEALLAGQRVQGGPGDLQELRQLQGEGPSVPTGGEVPQRGRGQGQGRRGEEGLVLAGVRVRAPGPQAAPAHPRAQPPGRPAQAVPAGPPAPGRLNGRAPPALVQGTASGALKPTESIPT